ncbi:PREDICTED: zinc finger Y-chromosomal protein-like [Rhinopithecus bieti]|uniref:zinc finger Y-chromosomal protein-like n=1 Tax=Rhinopithecus bieti TaxID=61621 RepID=UPI00083BE809|nr:PREDICTED: zinc finger Y-chromosomal protein-like [Rhinopithecus bieti]
MYFFCVISVNLVTKNFLFILCLDVAEIADEVYMEVIVGEEDAAVAAAAAAVHEQQIDEDEMKTFVPIAWAAAYGNNSDGIENRNGTASALLHVDESAGLGRLAKQKPKKKRRPDSRQYQTGEFHRSVMMEF